MEDCAWVEFAKCMRGAGIQVEALIEYVSLFQQGEDTTEARKQILIEQRELLLERMEEMEREGTTFKDKQREDARPVRYAAAVAASLIMVAFMAGAMALMAWGFTVEPEEAPPLALMAVLIALPGVVILGVLYALYQRIREIQKGEEDDAKNY